MQNLIGIANYYFPRRYLTLKTMNLLFSKSSKRVQIYFVVLMWRDYLSASSFLELSPVYFDILICLLSQLPKNYDFFRQSSSIKFSNGSFSSNYNPNDFILYIISFSKNILWFSFDTAYICSCWSVLFFVSTIFTV